MVYNKLIVSCFLCWLLVGGTQQQQHDSDSLPKSILSDLGLRVSVLGQAENNHPSDSDTWLHYGGAEPIKSRQLSRNTRQVDRRSQRATSTPLQGLSLLDLPVFSRGDRPSSMDKTLGAIFSKVAFSTVNNQSNSSGKNEVIEKNDAGNTTIRPTAKVMSTTSKLTSAATTPSTAESMTTRSKPVFEFDTRVFDFIPYDRTPPPPIPNRQYNPNVPGLRGPSRINTSRNPDIGQPMNLRPTIPPLVDLTSPASSTTTSSSSTPVTTTTTTTSTTMSVTTTTATTTTTTRAEMTTIDSSEDDKTPVPTTITAKSSTTVRNNIVSNKENVSLLERGDMKRADKNRESAWSVQVYGTSSLFALLGIFALSNLLRLRTSTRRLLSTSHCLSIQLLVLFLAITRSIHLLYDAYNHRRLLPPALAFCIFNVAFPCLSSALAVLLLGIFKATKLQVIPAVLVKPALWAALVAFHFALSLSIDIVVGSVGGLFSLHLASQAYFVLWSLALSLGYFAAFAPATRAAVALQAETMRTTLTALHIHGGALPHRLPRPTLLRAVKITLMASIFALLVAAFQLYGMFGVYGLPWRQQQTQLSANNVASTPVVLTPEFLARYQGTQRDRNLNVDALREVLGLANDNEPKNHDKRDPWPVATENFWPWWTYQLIARLLEFLMAVLIAYVGSQPLRHNEPITEKNVESATKKSSLWLFPGKSLKSGSMETLSSLCCQSNKTARNREMATAMGGVMTDLSPVKSMASEESHYPPNLRNYCYSNPSQSSQLERPSMPLPVEHTVTLPAFPAVYGSKRSQHRCASTLSHQRPSSSSVLVNDNGFIRFRDGNDQQETPYEEVDRNRSLEAHQQHIYQELSQKPHSLTYYSTSSLTSSSNTKGTTTTPSTCTYEHLCRRGLAGYYEPQRYEMQLPNTQLLNLLAKESCAVFQPNIYGSHRPCQHCHCKEISNCKSPNYESYGPKPEAQTPASQSDVLQVTTAPEMRSIPIFL